MAITVICRHCNGTGKVDSSRLFSRQKECEACKGKGKQDVKYIP